MSYYLQNLQYTFQVYGNRLKFVSKSSECIIHIWTCFVIQEPATPHLLKEKLKSATIWLPVSHTSSELVEMGHAFIRWINIYTTILENVLVVFEAYKLVPIKTRLVGKGGSLVDGIGAEFYFFFVK